MAEYDPQKIEPKWQAAWDAQEASRGKDLDSRPKYYILEMLPYPSGTLHMGHMRNYTIGDCVARYWRMRGCNVLHPIGWDSFGLPAENAAIQRGIPPRDWTLDNIEQLKLACKRFGFSYDWDREISTCEPEYYRWNQWFFIRMFERGLAYRKPSRVNWCPKCQTVLANEQAENGFCWRHSDTRVEAREIEQWFLRTTAYSEQLLEDIKQLESGWPERVLTMQRNWIGKSTGARVRFAVEGSASGIEVFTTRIDTIYGATAVILAPEHPMLNELLARSVEPGVAEKVAAMRQQGVKEADLMTLEKQGIFIGRYAVNPFSGEKLPIWVGNFVLMGYGTGAIMCVPAHDGRDFEFCRKYGLPVRVVVQPLQGGPLDGATMAKPFDEHQHGTLVNSGPYDGLAPQEAIPKMTADATSGGFGQAETTYRLKDWGISRQRYWGTPIPIIHCPGCGCVPVPDEDLPVLLPKNVELTGMGRSPLENVPEFMNVKCPKCGGMGRRETDTMDTFMDSSWYFYRYCDPRNDKAPFDRNIVAYWFPIDQYIGGIVHAILHLMYSRFFCKVMRDIGLVAHDEPVKKLFCQGTVLKGGQAMSKSSGNVVAAMDMADKYGCDTARLYTLFAAPPEKDMEWSEQSVEGCWRFLHRVFRLVDKHSSWLRNGTQAAAPMRTASAKDKLLLRKAHQTLKRVSSDLEVRWHFNASVALLMELVNEVHAQEPLEEGASPGVVREVFKLLTLMLAPMAPHIAEEMWQMLGHSGNAWKTAWPAYCADLAREELHEVVVQVNGKVRGRITVEDGLSEHEVVARALAEPKVAGQLDGKQVRKSIVVPNKLVNLVVG